MKSIGWCLLNVLQAVFLCVWTAFWITASLLSIIVTFKPNIAFWIASVPWSRGLLWSAGATLEVRGSERVDFSEPHIFVLNHQSMADIPVGFVALPVPLRFVAKKVLAYVPFLGWYMWAVGMVFVDRSHTARAVKSMAVAGTRIRDGVSVIAFPEGTRSRDGRVQPFKKGIFVVALEAGVPIVPVAVAGTLPLLPRGGYRVRPSHVRVNVGAPIVTTGFSRDNLIDLMGAVRSRMIELHREIGGLGGDVETVAVTNGARVATNEPARAAGS